MRKIKRKLSQIISLALVMALVCDQNIANARESMRQNAVSKAVAENTNIENIIQEDNTIIETQDETSVEPQTEVVFVNEMIDERSENSKQYMMSDKSVTVVMYDNPIHYEDENGNLVEIDNSLIKTQDGYTNGANTYDVVFSDDDATRGKVDFTEGGYGISWQLLEPKENPDLEETEAADSEQSADDGIKAAYARIAEEESKEAEETSKEATSGEEDTNSEEAADKESTVEEAVKAVAADSEVNDNTDYKDEKEYGYAAKQSSILFDGFTNDVSIEYIPQSDGIKENIIMNTKAPHYVHTFSIRLKGLKASLTEENEVVFYDVETGEPQYYFPAPFMVDDRGNISYDVTYRIESEESSTEESSSEESSTEENSVEESGTEESSIEESSTEQSNSEESSHEEASSQEKEASEESTAEKTTKEEASGETETQIFTEETETEETTVEETEESETEMSPTLLSSTVSDAYTEIKGVTLSGNAGTPKEEYIKESKTDQETETTREEVSSIIISEPESEPKQEEASEREAEPEHEASSEPESESENEMASEPKSESESESEHEASSEPESESENISEEESTIDEDAEQTITISIIPDSKWLETAAYPVTIDPLLKKSNGVKEITKVTINSSDSTRDTTTLKVGTKSGVTYRSFVKFDLPQLPKNCIITSAELTSASGQTDGLLYIEAHMIGGAWQPSTISWNSQPKSGNKLLDYANNHSYFNITKAVREWYEGTAPNNGILFKAYDESVQHTKNISFKVSKSKPYFKLNYIAAGGTENYWTTHNAAAGTAGNAYINDYLGYLTVVNSDIETAGERLPMSIRHIYNSCQTDTDLGAGYGWRLNYHQTLKIPTDTVDVTEYPYVWTDEDGTQHYFKKKGVTILQNGAGRELSSGASVPPAADEDGLGLYVIPVNDATLKNKYPFKLMDKSGSICRYFDKMGRLALIADANQYENGKNSSTKEKNCITITYEDAGAKAGTTAYDEALTKLNELKAAYDKNMSLAECTKVYQNVIPYIERLRGDIYAVSDYTTGKKVYEAYIAVETAEDSASYPTKRAQAKKAVEAVTEARSNAINLKSESAKRIKSITDAVGNTAVFSYDADGRISSITDPSAPNGGSYNKNASVKHTYRYTGGNLTGITYSNGKTASYSYDGDRNLTQMRDHAGYSVNLSYNAKKRVTQVSETGSSNAAGQKYTIAYHSDNTNEFRFSGANDIYGDSDDVINTYVFDEKGKALCEYSVLAGDSKKVIGATAVTYDGDEQDGTDTGNNKIKDSAVVGSHSINYLTNHSFELNDLAWQTYTAGGTLPAGAITAKSTKKHYIGQNCAYFDQTKAVKGTAGLKQSLTLRAGTYTFSGYAALDGADSSKAYLEVSANGTTYKSTVLTGTTAQEFDNGWQRLNVTFTISSQQKIEVRAAVECTASKGTGNIAFDCMQLEDGSTANRYNIMEDGSFERKLGAELVQLGWSYEGTGSTAQDSYALGESNVTDGEGSYHIVSEPGKNKSFTFKTYLGSDRASFTLTGWIKADTTPIRKDRELYVKARHKVSDTESIEAKQKINAYSKGWQYFCLMMPAKIWGSTTISIQFDDNIGDLYIDGLELTKNDVQTRVYNTNGKMTSKHVAQKDTSYGYDNYSRTDRVTIPDGAVSSYTYNGSNENTKISTSLGPNTYMTYDRYGNLLTTASYDADAAVKNELYAQNRYTDDGNFQSAAVDNRGYTTSYNYDKATGSLLTKTLPKRSGTTTQIQYSYNQYGQMTRLAEGNRAVDYGYDSDGNLTSITRNGFRYDYTYDGFGNLINTKIAGTTVSTNSYAPNNGTHTGTAYADGSRTSQDRDAYGRVIRSYITDAGGTRHQIDATVYDNDGNVKKYTDTANSLTTEYDYDDAGRVARSVVNKENNSAYNGSRVQYAYSKGGKIANLSYDTGDGKIKSYVYTYANDGLPEKSVFPDASYQTLSYDNLRRNSEKVYYPVKNATAAKRLYTTAAFTEGQSSVSSHKGSTTLIKTYTNKIGTTNKASEYTYAYDEWGNITGITESVRGNKGTYTYNEYGELTKAVEVYTKNKTAQSTCTYDYTYDSGENIKTEKVTGPSGTTTHTYTYDSVWKDKLISYDGNSITYDAMGNPTNYMGAAMTWDVKGNLTSVSGRNGKSASYTYLSDGQRYTKTTGGKTTTYLYNNGLLLSETTGNEVINYYYDSDGTILGIGYKKGSNDEKHYFFEKNAFGDVIAVYRNSDSMLIGTYEYDLWGNPVSVNEAASGRDTDGILQKNPFRYRCYYYDTETGFYYLNSRYYDPQIRRFISADDRILQTGENAKGYNLYSYCQNIPLGMVDYNGHSMTLTLTLTLPAIGAALSTVAAPVAIGVAIGITTAVTVHNVIKFKEIVDASINALEEEGKKRRNSIYTVYALSDDEGVRYVGRTKDYETRMKAHRKSLDKKNLKGSKLGENLTYEEARGLEQTAMLYYHTLKTAKGLNKINGISPNNKRAKIYMEEAKGVAGYITNQISNEILDWMDK